ncbi:MAG TPA: tetratricopeptide repeat protein [Verrucomicrobiae bacterium]|nr:tetratricopeptide repeat protein [Verrucomicrobiae bacterium]
MGATDRFSPEDVQRIVGLTRKQLDYWHRLRLVSPREQQGTRYYDFRDLIGLRTVKQLLENGVSANRLQRALSALNRKLDQVQTPLSQLRILSDGKDVVVEQGSARLEPLSGQFLLNFETRELDESIRFVTRHSPSDWFAIALSYESNKETRSDAISAYHHCIDGEPDHADALLNCGTLHYEDGNFEKAAEFFRRALDAQPQNPLAHFNLGSVLEDMGQLEEARKHLRQALLLDRDYCDAHYNLAFVCEKLQCFPEAREHWQAYIQLDPTGPWSNYARQRLAASQLAKSVTR